MDSLPPGFLEGRPAGNSFLLTSHQVNAIHDLHTSQTQCSCTYFMFISYPFQLQQLQQQLQVATANQQHQQTEQVATASGGLTLALHHHSAVSN